LDGFLLGCISSPPPLPFPSPLDSNESDGALIIATTTTTTTTTNTMDATPTPPSFPNVFYPSTTLGEDANERCDLPASASLPPQVRAAEIETSGNKRQKRKRTTKRKENKVEKSAVKRSRRPTQRPLTSDAAFAAPPKTICEFEPYFGMPQGDAALACRMKASSFSKLWRRVSGGQRWPYRTIRSAANMACTDTYTYYRQAFAPGWTVECRGAPADESATNPVEPEAELEAGEADLRNEYYSCLQFVNLRGGGPTLAS
jgi:hypothetical protein